MSMFGLKGKVAIVTGGNGGIGLGMARGLATAGADVVVAGRKAGKSKEAAAELAKLGVRTAVVEVDVADEASCKAMVAAAAKQMGRVDILVNNAGINIRKPPETYTSKEWREILSINLDGAFYCSQAVYPEMKKAGGGKIINIGSMMSIFGAPLTTAYAASKGGIVQMTRALATAWAKDNIQVEFDPAGLDRHRTDAARPRRYRGSQRERAGADAGRALGYAGGFLRHRRVPWPRPRLTSSRDRRSRCAVASRSAGRVWASEHRGVCCKRVAGAPIFHVGTEINRSAMNLVQCGRMTTTGC